MGISVITVVETTYPKRIGVLTKRPNYEYANTHNKPLFFRIVVVDCMKGMFNMKCCFCKADVVDIGNSPYPFFRTSEELVGCCDKCNARYVTPIRALYDKDFTPDYKVANALSDILYSIKMFG